MRIQRQGWLTLGCVLVAFGLAAFGTTRAAFTAVTSNADSLAAANFCPSPSVVSMTGMEHGVVSAAGGGIFTAVSTAGGGVTADPNRARSGMYDLRIADTSATANSSARLDAGGGSVAVLRFAIRLGSLPGSDVAELMGVAHARLHALQFGYAAASHKFTVGYDQNTKQVSTTTVSAGVWYLVDLRVDTSDTSTVTADWRVNGVAQAQATAAETGGDVDSYAWFGSGNGSGAVVTDQFTAFYDDILISDAAADYPLPDGHIQRLLPSGTATIANTNGYLKENASSTPITGGDWSYLTDWPNNGSQYIRQTTAGATTYANVTFPALSQPGCVNGLRALVAYAATGGAADQAATSIYEGANQTVVNDDDVSAGGYRGKVIRAASGNWTEAKISGLQAQIGKASSTASAPRWDALMLEYDLTPDPTNRYRAAVLADSPAGYWRLGETTGSTAAAAAGGITGTYTNGPLLGVAGAVGDGDGGVYFDGVNDEVDLGQNYGFAGTSAFSAEAWVDLHSTSTTGAIVGREDSSGGYHGWAMFYYTLAQCGGAAGCFTVERVNSDTSGDDECYGTTVPAANRWYHVVATYDGATLRLYVNGTLEATCASTTSLQAGATDAFIGTDGEGAGGAIVNATIDEAAVYTGELSQARITAHYNAGKP